MNLHKFCLILCILTIDAMAFPETLPGSEKQALADQPKFVKKQRKSMYKRILPLKRPNPAYLAKYDDAELNDLTLLFRDGVRIRDHSKTKSNFPHHHDREQRPARPILRADSTGSSSSTSSGKGDAHVRFATNVKVHLNVVGQDNDRVKMDIEYEPVKEVREVANRLEAGAITYTQEQLEMSWLLSYDVRKMFEMSRREVEKKSRADDCGPGMNKTRSKEIQKLVFNSLQHRFNKTNDIFNQTATVINLVDYNYANVNLGGLRTTVSAFRPAFALSGRIRSYFAKAEVKILLAILEKYFTEHGIWDVDLRETLEDDCDCYVGRSAVTVPLEYLYSTLSNDVQQFMTTRHQALALSLFNQISSIVSKTVNNVEQRVRKSISNELLRRGRNTHVKTLVDNYELVNLSKSKLAFWQKMSEAFNGLVDNLKQEAQVSVYEANHTNHNLAAIYSDFRQALLSQIFKRFKAKTDMNAVMKRLDKLFDISSDLQTLEHRHETAKAIAQDMLSHDISVEEDLALEVEPRLYNLRSVIDVLVFKCAASTIAESVILDMKNWVSINEEDWSRTVLENLRVAYTVLFASQYFSHILTTII